MNILKLFALSSAVALLVACAQPAAPPAPAPEEPQAEVEAEATQQQEQESEGFQLAIITDTSGVNDRSFNQGSWEGIQRAATTLGLNAHHFTANANSDPDFLNTIDLALSGGAQLIVMPGFLLQTAAYQAQDIYPHINFVLVDGLPHNPQTGETRIEPNAVALIYAEEQAGFLAGYSAVMEGHRALGFMGGVAVPQVVHFGYGFLQGAQHAAQALELAPGAVTVHYLYTNTFSPSPEVQTTAASWFNVAGVEVIFAAGGSMGLSVMAAAEANNGLVIGVDVDQYHESPAVLTSALKQLGNAVYAAILDWYEGEIEGRESWMFDATNDGIGLPMQTSRFQNFTYAQYEEILGQLSEGTIHVIRDHALSVEDLGLDLLDITVLN